MYHHVNEPFRKLGKRLCLSNFLLCRITFLKNYLVNIFLCTQTCSKITPFLGLEIHTCMWARDETYQFMQQHSTRPCFFLQLSIFMCIQIHSTIIILYKNIDDQWFCIPTVGIHCKRRWLLQTRIYRNSGLRNDWERTYAGRTGLYPPKKICYPVKQHICDLNVFVKIL